MSVTVSNSYISSNNDYVVKTRALADASQVQLVQIDIGTGTTSDPVTSANPIPITTIVGSASVTSSVTESTLGVTTSSQALIAADSTRRGGYLQNTSTQNIFYSYSGTATVGDFVLGPYQSLDFMLGRDGKIYTGQMSFIHAGTGTKNLKLVTHT